jgi:hypothetical protein
VGEPTQPCSYTSILDVGKTIAILASSPLSTIPAEVQLNGDSKSFAQIAEIMSNSGGGSIDVSSIPLAEYKQDVLSKPSPTPERYLRFLMGEGKIDHTDAALGNQNSLVQGKPGFEKWKSIQDLAIETHGLPWVDADWEAST